jgi:maleylacetate reductase
MRPFVYEQLPLRVVFAAGAVERIRDEAHRLGRHSALVLTTPGRRALADEVSTRLADDSAGVFAEAVVHVPMETARAAQTVAARLGADCLVAVGGGSTIGLAKAVALETALPILAVPTTYAGSEMTPIYGLTDGGVKKTGRDPRVLPRTVVYDPAVTLTLPATISASSGLNAIAHSVEALYAVDANPITSMLSAESIRVLARALPVVVTDPSNLDARSDALYGACLAGAALAATSMGLHHKLCHAVGGAFKLPHAEVHAVILPHATAFNREAAPSAMRAIGAALGARDPAQGIYDLAVRLGAPVALAEIGMPADGLDRAARIAVERPYDNPRPIEYSGIRRLLDDAYCGRRPA